MPFRAKLEAFLLRTLEEGVILDGAIAQDISQASIFWRIREVIPLVTYCFIATVRP